MKQILIIGNSAAGVAAAEALRNKDKSCGITILSGENYTAYNRCLISYYLAGDIKEDKLILRDKSFYKDNNINLLLGKKAIRIDAKKNQVLLEDKTRLDYDYLILANGASPKIPQIKGIQKEGVFGLRTIEDVKKIIESSLISPHACVLGGGLVGLKAAYALKRRGVDIKVIVKSKNVLSQVLDEKAAEIFTRHFIKNGVDILTELDVQEIIGESEVKAIKLDSGKVIASSIVVVGKGVKPNLELIESSGIKAEEGVLVDENLKTNIANVYAAGDIAQTYDLLLEKTAVNALWPNAVEQGKFAAENILGNTAKYAGSVGMNSVEFFGLPVISFGLARAQDGCEEVIYQDTTRGIYKKIVLKDNLIKGAILVTDIENAGVYLNLAKKKTDISSVKNELLGLNFNFPAVYDLVKDREKIYL